MTGREKLIAFYLPVWYNQLYINKSRNRFINILTNHRFYGIVDGRMEEPGLFFMLKNAGKGLEVVRTRITLACTECKQRNYNMTKDKKTHPDRMETKKYCRFCKRHTMHKETK